MRSEFEKIVTPSQSSFVCRRYVVPRFSTPWHFHPEIELTLIVKSKGRRFVGDSIAPFADGDLVLIGSNLSHFWCNEWKTKSLEEAISIVVQFREHFLGEDFFQKPEMRLIRRLFQRASRGIQFLGKTRDRIAQKMEEMGGSQGLDRVIGLLKILSILAESHDYKLLSSPEHAPSLNTKYMGRIDKIFQFVDQNHRQSIRLDDVAPQVHMAPSAFSRFFRQKTGKTFSAFVNELRIGDACRLLMEEEMNVTEACYASGFNNVSNFNRRFRQLKGVNPRQFCRSFQSAAKSMKNDP